MLDFIETCKIIAEKGIKELYIDGLPKIDSKKPIFVDDVKFNPLVGCQFLRIGLSPQPSLEELGYYAPLMISNTKSGTVTNEGNKYIFVMPYNKTLKITYTIITN